MKRTLEELTSAFSEIASERTDDAVISFMEDLSDSYSDSSEEVIRLKEENENLRRKYIERFNNSEGGGVTDTAEEEEEHEENEKRDVLKGVI